MTDGAWELDVYPEARKVLSFCLPGVGLARGIFSVTALLAIGRGKALKYQLKRWCFVEGKPKTFL